MNIIRMMSWTGSWLNLTNFGNRSHSEWMSDRIRRTYHYLILIALLLCVCSNAAHAQSRGANSPYPYTLQSSASSGLTSSQDILLYDRLAQHNGDYYAPRDTIQNQESEQQQFPPPRKVLFRSMMIPGWGQITNKQAWKVPIIYGLLGGLAGYSVYLNKKYHDYRAAYYNEVYKDQEGGSDFKFGPTPDYIPEGSDLGSLRYNRNYYRNQRDFMYIAVGLAYGLNVVDAYIFAHMRSFDVSDDLSASARISPDYQQGAVGLKLSLRFSAK